MFLCAHYKEPGEGRQGKNVVAADPRTYCRSAASPAKEPEPRRTQAPKIVAKESRAGLLEGGDLCQPGLLDIVGRTRLRAGYGYVTNLSIVAVLGRGPQCMRQGSV